MKRYSRSHHILTLTNKDPVLVHNSNALEKHDSNLNLLASACNLFSNDAQPSGVSTDNSTSNLPQEPQLDINSSALEIPLLTMGNNVGVTSLIDSVHFEEHILVDQDDQNKSIQDVPSSVIHNDEEFICNASFDLIELENATTINRLEFQDTQGITFQCTPNVSTVSPASPPKIRTPSPEPPPDNCDLNIFGNTTSYTDLILNSETGLFEPVVTSSIDNETSVNSVSVKDQRRLNQILRMHGKSYTSKVVATVDGAKVSFVRSERKLKNVPCNHGSEAKSERSFLCGSIIEEARQNVFDYFWSLPSWEAKRSYIIGLVTVRNVNKRRKLTEASVETDTKKSNGIDCYLPDHNGSKWRVCRDFFLATLDIKKDSFTDWVNAKHAVKISLPSIETDKNPNPPKALKSDSVIKWLQEIPKVPSHYCRSNTSRTYVDDALQSLSKMHTVYTLWCQENQVPSVQRKKFCEVLESQKISIFKPRKDQCDTCVAYREGNLDEGTYETHMTKKTEAREAKQRAISEASNEHCVATMDLQSVQLCPKLLVSAQYYKQKLQVHIFTIYINNNKDVLVYIWHEGDAGVTANEFISCIMDFLKNQKESKGYNKFTLISDGCAYQNKNKVLASAFADISKSENLHIEQIILEKGHTMMEVDSVHSTLEKLFKPPLYSPTDYVNRIRQARPTQPYEVYHVDFSFFKNYDALPSNFSSIRPGKKAGDPTVTDIRALLYKNGDVWYKLFHKDDWSLLPQRRKSELYQPPALLYELPKKIEKSKFDHLQLLLPYMHRDYHSFYQNLRF